MDLTKLVHEREIRVAQINRTAEYFHNADNVSASMIEYRLSNIEKAWNEVNTMQSEIEFLSKNTKSYNKQLEIREQMEMNYFSTVSLATDLLGAKRPTLNTNPNLSQTIKLPVINLPQFDGNYEHWLNFYDTFNTIVHQNNQLSDVQKFQYLKSSLKGNAADILESLELSNSNYVIAWDLLRERYQNTRLMKANHIKAIFEQIPISKATHISLRNMLDSSLKHLRALKSLDEPIDQWDLPMLYLLTSKLDFYTRKEWESSLKQNSSPKLEEFFSFLRNRCQILEAIDSGNKKQTPKTHVHISTNSFSCAFCKGNHFTQKCKKFLDNSPKDRVSHIKKLKLCINCLRPGHISTECRSSSCKTCGKKHNTILHTAFDRSSVVTTDESFIDEGNMQPSVNNHCSQNSDHILLSTVLVNILNHKGELIKCRALLDSGSQSNFITLELSKRLKLPCLCVNIPIVGINQSNSQTTSMITSTLKSLDGLFSANLSLLVLNKITNKLPAIPFSTSKLSIPPGIALADPTFNQPGQIDILLGAGIFWDILRPEKIKLGNKITIMQNTKLGWVISGPININIPQNISNCHLAIENDIKSIVEKFWSIENLPPKTHLTKQELECEDHFRKNTFKDENGRFVVKLPMINESPEFLDSELIAIRRFLSLEKRLSTNLTLKQMYTDFMREYENLGHMSKITTPNPSNSKFFFYLPHHGVLKADSKFTKLRVVFDGSSKCTNGNSLNDVLKVGPIIQDDLFSILLRFRKHNFAITADIAKMYRQVGIHHEHRHLQRIVWRESPKEKLQHFELNTVTYGTSPASFLAIRCLHQIALENAHEFPIESRAILKDFYVDDFISGADTIENLARLKENVSHLLSKSGFQLRQWSSSHTKFTGANHPSLSEFHLDGDQYVKTLGLLWDSNLDILKYKVSINLEKKDSKRGVLSSVANVFDPLGLIGPVTTKSKIFLQRLWQLKLSWDDALPDDFSKSWYTFRSKLSYINNIKIPRQVTVTNFIKIQVHGFCDASEMAYGACIYLRSVDNKGKCITNLFCSKSRVAPLKNISLPRLELCAAFLLAQLVDKVLNSIETQIESIYLWSDSTIVLNWLAAEPNVWKTFVTNRIAEIQQKTSNCQWRHVPSAQNPADVISRGVDPDQLAHFSLWWHGPAWLCEQPDTWPRNIVDNIVTLEKRTVKQCLLNIQDYDILYKYSSLSKLQHVVAYCLRFLKNAVSDKNSRTIGKLTVFEMKRSIKHIIKLLQADSFHTEKILLQQGKPLPSSSKLLSLNPFLDNEGIIRVGGRLSSSNIAYSGKHPVVIPSKHHVTELIIKYVHITNLHSGLLTTLNAVRLEYWPIDGRSSVKRIIRRCLICSRAKPLPIVQLMGDLPENRVKPSRPFYSSGVDFAGPIYIKDGKLRNRKIIKSYICVFVCFSTKAIHIELASDLSTNAFLNCLTRFTSRRGISKNIYSDNGTNFVGTCNELKQIVKNVIKHVDDPEIISYLLANQIEWHFIPPRSPHFGGLWEAAVKSIKTHLSKIVSNINLTYEEMNTVLIQIEAVLNSRPLTPLSSDINDLNALTPSHFLIGDTLNALPQENIDIKTTGLSKYKHLQMMVQHYWTRWTNEYLNNLQQRSKWKRQPKECPQSGDLVVIMDKTPPMLWKLGRIETIHPGKDGIVRTVSVKTSSGVVKRATNKICLLPLK